MAEQDQLTMEGTQRGEQTVTVEDIGPARKRLRIEVPEKRIAEKIVSKYEQLQTDALVPGFRRGRVPKGLLERRFGRSVRDDVRAQLITESYTQAIEDEKLDVVGEPEIKDFNQIQLPETGALTFEVEVEVSPVVELPDFSGIEVRKPEARVSDEDVNQEIERLRTRLGRFETIQEGVIEAGQHLLCSVRVLEGKDAADDATVIATHDEAAVLVPGQETQFKGEVAGILVENLGNELIGKKSGDAVRLSLTGPAGHEEEQIREKPITLVVQIRSVHRREPMSLEDLMAYIGRETEERLKDYIRDVLTDRATRQQTFEMHRQICAHLLENVALDLPQGLTTRQAVRLLRRQAMEMAYQGMDRQEIEQRIAHLRAGTQEQASRQLKLFFILDQAARNFEIDVSDGEINGRIALMALQQGRRPEKLRQQMRRSGEIESLYLMIREEKTLNKILDQAKVISSEENPDPPQAEAGSDAT